MLLIGYSPNIQSHLSLPLFNNEQNITWGGNEKWEVMGVASANLQNQNFLIHWLYCRPLVWLVELLGQRCQEPLSLDILKRREGFSHSTLPPCFPCPGVSIHQFLAPLAGSAWLLYTFEDFAFLWHLIPCSPLPGSQILPNICLTLPYQNNLAFSKVTMNTSCSQKYNPYHFPFPKTVGEFFSSN